MWVGIKMEIRIQIGLQNDADPHHWFRMYWYVRLYLHCKSVLKSQYLLTYLTSKLPQTRGLPVYRISVNISKKNLSDWLLVL